jgi:hypothetical protein|tara:strand:+ start:1084 stop:1725 length:642 start_codon:yes stop_codon:yes gene_type:complete
MIKLKQLIKESLKDMVFSKSIKPKHKKRMGIKNKLFPSNPKLTITPPPANDSNETRTELFKLLAYNDGVIDRKMVEEYDDMTKPFMELIEKHNVDVTKDDLQQIIDEGAKFTLKIKYKYNRPRPYQIAEHYGIEDFKRHKLDTAKTPSYPSGHALQGRLIGLILTDKDPEHQNEYMAVSQRISDSRIMARAHYPSDKEYGEKLADELYEQMIK